MNHDYFIELYFHLGLPYKDIKETLSNEHNYTISLRHLKRKLRTLGLTRRKDYSDLMSLFDFMDNQLKTTGKLHGYRWLYHKCIIHGLKVKKEQVRHLLDILDPYGVDLRQRRCLKRRLYWSKGPNFCWHIDGYDKLKPYGLCISGCIDGFSRKVIWLKAGRSNKNPKIIANYFIDAVEEQRGCPLTIRADMGTENVQVAGMQRFFRRADENEESNNNSFIYGKSTTNTRIESWWGILRKECCQIWIEDLRMLRDQGVFTGSVLDINLVQFCFMRLLQEELDEALMVWNVHRIRPSRNTNTPSGQPNTLYLMPHLANSRDYICRVPKLEIDVCRMECATGSIYPCEEEVFELCCLYMIENNLGPPKDILSARILYLKLRHWVLLQL